MPPADLPRGGRRALLVAHGTYADPGLRKLRAPTGDVEALQRVLADPAIGDFEVERVVDQETYYVKGRIEAFFASGHPDDLLLLYISGHGLMSEDRQLYFATSSTERELLDTTAIEDSFVARQMNRSRTRARSIVLILDCCHSGAFGRGFVAKGADTRVDIEERFSRAMPPPRRSGEQPRGHVVLTASSDLEYAFEDTDLDTFHPSQPGSVFTRFLVQGLATGEADRDPRNGLIDIEELHRYARERVMDLVPHQTPGRVIKTSGPLIVARNPIPVVHEADPPPLTPPPPPPPPPPLPPALRHDDIVRSVAFSPDGERVATASDDRSARIWDVRTRAELMRIVHPTGRWPSRKLHDVAFAPDGERIATAGRDHSARMWDRGGMSKQPRIVHGNWIRAVSFSPSGRFIATAGEDRTARAWDLQENDNHLTVGSSKSLNTVAFSADSTRLAAAGNDGSASVWDLDRKQQLQCFSHDEPVMGVAFGAGPGRLATACKDGFGRIWQVGEQRPLMALEHGGVVRSVAFSADGAVLATGGSDGYVRVWDPADGGELYALKHPAEVLKVAFSPTGGMLAAACADCTARLWEL